MDYLGFFLMELITGTVGGTLLSVCWEIFYRWCLLNQTTSCVAALAVPRAIVFSKWWHKYSRLVSIVDALGLGLFPCVGARTALIGGPGWGW